MCLHRVTYPHRRQVPRFDLEHGGIRQFVDTDDLGGEFTPVGELDGDFRGPVHHMGIGQNDAIRSHDESGTHALGRGFIGWRLRSKKGQERVRGAGSLRFIRVGFRRLGSNGADVDDRGSAARGYRRKVGDDGRAGRQGVRASHRGTCRLAGRGWLWLGCLGIS